MSHGAIFTMKLLFLGLSTITAFHVPAQPAPTSGFMVIPQHVAVNEFRSTQRRHMHSTPPNSPVAALARTTRTTTTTVLAVPARVQPPRTRTTTVVLTAVILREADTRSRDEQLPDIRQALDEVSLFISKASHQRKPLAPSAACIERYCRHCFYNYARPHHHRHPYHSCWWGDSKGSPIYQQWKIDLLLAEAKALRECEALPQSALDEVCEVRWTDIDGNDAADAAWCDVGI